MERAMSDHAQVHDTGFPSRQKRPLSNTLLDEGAEFAQQVPAALLQQAILDPASLSPAILLQLQRTVGNQAVIRMVSGAQPVVQRVATGLARKTSVQTFANSLVAWKRANGAKPLEELANWGVKLVNVELGNAKIPPVTGGYNAPAYVTGRFTSDTWAIQLNKKRFTKRPGVTLVSQLNDSEVSNIAQAIYHEARHAEQIYRMARYMAGQGKTQKQIMDALEISADIATAAAKKKLLPPGQKASGLERTRYSEAEAWYRSTTGRDKTYNTLIMSTLDDLAPLKKLVRGITTKAKYASKRAAVDGHMNKLRARLPECAKERDRLVAIANRSAVENKMLAHVRKHIAYIGWVLRRWGKVAQFTTLEDFRHQVVRPVDAATRINSRAYRELPDEADARRVGESVELSTLAKLKNLRSAPPPPAPLPVPASPAPSPASGPTGSSTEPRPPAPLPAPREPSPETEP